MEEKPEKIQLAQQIAVLLDKVNNTSLKKHQDSPHQLGSDSKELGAVPPVGPLLIYKFDVGFLHKGRGL